MEIAKSKTIKPTKGGWLVKSQSPNNCYKVDEELLCNCHDAECRGITCKHAFAVRYYLQIERNTASGTETDKVIISHKQAWKAYTAAQTDEVRRLICSSKTL